jgi:hypothetical protein
MKYNGKELQSGEFKDGSGLEWYDCGGRMLDAQTGRWGVVDPFSSEGHKKPLRISFAYPPYNFAAYIKTDFMIPSILLELHDQKKNSIIIRK